MQHAQGHARGQRQFMSPVRGAGMHGAKHHVYRREGTSDAQHHRRRLAHRRRELDGRFVEHVGRWHAEPKVLAHVQVGCLAVDGARAVGGGTGVHDGLGLAVYDLEADALGERQRARPVLRVRERRLEHEAHRGASSDHLDDHLEASRTRGAAIDGEGRLACRDARAAGRARHVSLTYEERAPPLDD